MSLALAAQLTNALVMVAVVVGALELLLSPAALRRDGFYSWDVLRTGHTSALSGRLAAPTARLFDQRGMACVFATQIAAAILAIAQVGPVALWIAVALAGNLALHVRNTYGLDGSDQMQTVVLAGLLMFHAAQDDTGRQIALGFIAGQALLSYFASGYAKLISPVWRDGTAIVGVLDTKSYGSVTASRIIGRRAVIAKALCWATLVFECLMPLLVLTGPAGCLVFIGAGLVMHAAIAVTMGLNLFVWSFAATYPCLYLVSTWLG